MINSAKRFFAFAVTIIISAIIFFTAPFGVVADSAVVVTNAGFESTKIDKNAKVPSDWKLASSYLYISFSTENAVSGQSLRIAKGTNFSFESEDYIAISNGDFTFGYKCFAEAANISASIAVQTYDKDELFIEKLIGESITVTTGNWQSVFLTTTLSDGVSYVKLIITVNTANSACYLDDVYIEPAEKLPALNLSTLTGASLRLVTDNAGIRFRGTVDKTAYDTYAQKFDNVCAGILFTVEENLSGLNDFTVETLSANSKMYKEIPAEKWNNPVTAKDDGYYGFNCAIVKIKDVNIEKKYCARTYLKYDDNGQTYYVYGNFTLSDNARSVKELALIAINDIESYAPEQRSIIEYFANFTFSE